MGIGVWVGSGVVVGGVLVRVLQAKTIAVARIIRNSRRSLKLVFIGAPDLKNS